MTIRECYRRAGQRLLARHNIRSNTLEKRYWKESAAHFAGRTVTAPEPVDAKTFYIFAHEVAHLVLNHNNYSWGGYEIEADVWAMKQIKRTRGYIPSTILRLARQNGGRVVAQALRAGKPRGLDLQDILKLSR